MQGRGRSRKRGRLSPDARRILAAQAARALAYGLGSVLIGVTLATSGLAPAQVGLVLAVILAGSALASLAIAREADRIGRRRCYRLLFATMGAAGAVFALTNWLPALLLAALTGTVSTDVVSRRNGCSRTTRSSTAATAHGASCSKHAESATC